MARAVVALLLLSLIVHFVPEVYAAPNTPTFNKARERFKQRCDDGSGKACYDYAMSLWSLKAAEAQQQEAMTYAHRGCALKFQASCEWSRQHSTKTLRIHKEEGKENGEGVGDICFSIPQFGNARLTPFETSPGVVHGQKIDMIRANSFWERAGLKEGDIIVKVNNMPFNTSKEAMSAFSSSGKKFGFEVSRTDEIITLWYSCR